MTKKQLALIQSVVVLLTSLAFFVYAKTTSTQTGSVADTATRPGWSLVTKVIDGDTFVIDDGSHVRLIGIDTPETVDPRRPVGCFGKEASDFTKKMLLGKEVHLVKDISETDKYGRLLRLVYLENASGEYLYNDYLVRQGYAYAKTWPPDVTYQEQFKQAQQEARENNRGLWAKCPS